jgi:hypothetical protein
MKQSVTHKSVRFINRLINHLKRRKALQLEDEIVRLAKEGKLATAGQKLCKVHCRKAFHLL